MAEETKGNYESGFSPEEIEKGRKKGEELAKKNKDSYSDKSEDMQEFLQELDSYEKAGDVDSKKLGLMIGESRKKVDTEDKGEKNHIGTLDVDESSIKQTYEKAGVVGVRGYIKKAIEERLDQYNGDTNRDPTPYKKIIDVAANYGLLESNKSTRNQISKAIKNIGTGPVKKEVARYAKEKLSDSYEKSSDSYSKE